MAKKPVVVTADNYPPLKLAIEAITKDKKVVKAMMMEIYQATARILRKTAKGVGAHPTPLDGDLLASWFFYQGGLATVRERMAKKPAKKK